MRYFVLLSMCFSLGCVGTAPTSDDSVRFQASDRAMAVIEDQGKATAVMLGYADDTELVCERFYKAGSHIMTSFCYTRGEMERRRLNHQEEYRRISEPGAKCFGGVVGADGQGHGVVSQPGFTC